ncbi:MAG: ATP-binding cassette domain-containing protein [Gammaproteobacteria bacterium]|jgi:tungstate transport system ATP-binding protein|nr:ATP-binding cassette domain-containing protein [Gammaproteobacteria bacterium]
MSSKTAASLLPLEVDALCYRVEREDLLKDISVTVDSAGITGILGPNGAGKSLFLRLLHGLLEPVSGEIRWHHQRLDKTIRRRQALVFQKPVLMRRSVAANIDFVLNPGTRSRQRRDEVLQHAGLYRQRSQPARLLSGGEQQRLALARALATEPEVLLLDEPCASLDSATTLQIENLLQETSARGVKIVLVTHDIGQARRLADDVIFMHGGRLLEYQTASTFFDSPSSSQARAYLDGKIVI